MEPVARVHGRRGRRVMALLVLPFLAEFTFGLKPVIPVMTGLAAAPFVNFIRATSNSVVGNFCRHSDPVAESEVSLSSIGIDTPCRHCGTVFDDRLHPE